MYPAPFDYERPEVLEEALDLVAHYGDKARILAGGASLIPMMKLRLARPERLIDIGRLDELAGLSWFDDHLAIGALTKHVGLQDAPLVRQRFPLLHDLVSQIGDPQIRNMGTVGGSVAGADPSSDWGPGLLALDGAVCCVSQGGRRVIAARDFFLDLYTTALTPDEIVTEILCPLPPPHTGGAHLKLERRSGDYAIANCSVQVTLDAVGRYQDIGIGIGGVSTMAIKVVAAEDLLKGELPGEALHRQAAHLVATCTSIHSDIRGSAEYRGQVLHILFRRALAIAERRARGEVVEVHHV